jgi:hypothetical protein
MSDPVVPEVEEDDAIVGVGSFNQDSVNAIVKQRLARQRAKYETQLTTLSTQLADAVSKLKTATEQVTKHDAELAKSLESKVKALPEPIQKLLAKMPLADQAAWITENPDLTTVTDPSKRVPVTPPASGTQPTEDEIVARKRQSSQYGTSI